MFKICMMDQNRMAKQDKGTFDLDEHLPNLPVPPLEHTIQRYLDSVKPFAGSQQEYVETTKVAHRFMNGEGAVLHSKLVERAEKHRNWVERWWMDYAYLSSREPLIPFCNMVGRHPLVLSQLSQIQRASAYCHQMVRLWQLLRQEKVPTATNRNNRPLSMDQFRRLFNCSVTPGVTIDTISALFKTEKEGKCSSLVVVMCNANMFVVDGLQDDGQPLSPEQWEHQLQLIQQRASAQRGPELSHLVCDYRHNWAKNRQHMIELSEVNAKNLAVISEAMFVVSLDDDRPDPESVTQQLLCGDYSSRWPDVANNAVFFSNGQSGTLSLHSALDGIVSGTATLFAFSEMQEMTYHWSPLSNTDTLPEPRQLNFVLDSLIHSQISKAKNEQQVEKKKVLMRQEEFKQFGKQRIKDHDIHPDTFIQIALQLAYYRLHSKPGACYETATTRPFYRGRTETVRSCTEECVRWVEAMNDPQSPISSRFNLLQKAVRKHDQLMREACSGLGCDRHLFGIYCVVLENSLPMPDIFTDPLFSKSGGDGNFVLSTSLLGYSPVYGGVAPMCYDGYGIFYSISPDSLMFTISEWKDCPKTSSSQMFLQICDALQDMIRLVESQKPSKL